MEIIVSPLLITGATILLGFVFNTILVKAGIALSTIAKKTIVFAVSVGITYYAATLGELQFNLPIDPAEAALYVLSLATAVFKVAQVVYDQIRARLT